MVFQTHFNKQQFRPETNSGEMITEQAGYVPPAVQINQFIQAGQRLDAFKKGVYEFTTDKDVPDDYVDPTRMVGFDLADASAMTLEVKNRLKAQALEAQAKKEAESAKEEPAE